MKKLIIYIIGIITSLIGILYFYNSFFLFPHNFHNFYIGLPLIIVGIGLVLRQNWARFIFILIAIVFTVLVIKDTYYYLFIHPDEPYWAGFPDSIDKSISCRSLNFEYKGCVAPQKALMYFVLGIMPAIFAIYLFRLKDFKK